MEDCWHFVLQAELDGLAEHEDWPEADDPQGIASRDALGARPSDGRGLGGHLCGKAKVDAGAAVRAMLDLGISIIKYEEGPVAIHVLRVAGVDRRLAVLERRGRGRCRHGRHC